MGPGPDGACQLRINENTMKIGYRAVDKEDIGRFPVDLVQISYWKTFGPDIAQIKKIASRCRELEVRYVMHPVFTPLSETRAGLREKNLEELTTLARMADLGMIVHDETNPDRSRLSGERMAQYRKTLEMISSSCPVSIENAVNTLDIDWFWNELGGSITLDIGHFESAGIDPIKKVQSLPEDLLDRVEYVHMHRKNGPHGGVIDHWPLTDDCREVQAMKELFRRKKNLAVILEINEMDQLGESLEILQKIRAD
jgi:sugar phosphate isomerase/epimerase